LLRSCEGERATQRSADATRAEFENAQRTMQEALEATSSLDQVLFAADAVEARQDLEDHDLDSLCAVGGQGVDGSGHINSMASNALIADFENEETEGPTEPLLGVVSKEEVEVSDSVAHGTLDSAPCALNSVIAVATVPELPKTNACLPLDLSRVDGSGVDPPNLSEIEVIRLEVQNALLLSFFGEEDPVESPGAAILQRRKKKHKTKEIDLEHSKASRRNTKRLNSALGLDAHAVEEANISDAKRHSCKNLMLKHNSKNLNLDGTVCNASSPAGDESSRKDELDPGESVEVLEELAAENKKLKADMAEASKCLERLQREQDALRDRSPKAG